MNDNKAKPVTNTFSKTVSEKLKKEPSTKSIKEVRALYQNPMKEPDKMVDFPAAELVKVNMNINDFEISPKRLQEAILWSEILGKPVSKRRKRKVYGN